MLICSLWVAIVCTLGSHSKGVHERGMGGRKGRRKGGVEGGGWEEWSEEEQRPPWIDDFALSASVSINFQIQVMSTRRTLTLIHSPIVLHTGHQQQTRVIGDGRKEGKKKGKRERRGGGKRGGGEEGKKEREGKE